MSFIPTTYSFNLVFLGVQNSGFLSQTIRRGYISYCVQWMNLYFCLQKNHNKLDYLWSYIMRHFAWFLKWFFYEIQHLYIVCICFRRILSFLKSLINCPIILPRPVFFRIGFVLIYKFFRNIFWRRMPWDHNNEFDQHCIVFSHKYSAAFITIETFSHVHFCIFQETS